MTLLFLLEQRIADTGALMISDAELATLTDDDARTLLDRHGSHVLMRLPPSEQAFFAWLRENDPEVWNDLWADDPDLMVSLDFLIPLREGDRGFMICELEQTPNYFFTERHIKPEGIEVLESIFRRIREGAEISIAEGLLFEIVQRPIDLWRFCFKHQVSISAAKRAVRQLVEHGWLVHLPNRDDLLPYLDSRD
jgi:hypothetical protein